MTRYVVDASVAVKWFVPEELTDEALSVLDDDHELLVPDLLWPEFGNILWKKARRGELVVDEVSEILSLCREVPFEVVDSGSLIESAIQIALEMDRTVYDSVYLALAVERDCVMVTADRRLVNAIQTSSWGRFVIDLADT